MVPPNHPILIGFGTIINHPFWGTPIFGNTHVVIGCSSSKQIDESYFCHPRDTDFSGVCGDAN